MSGLSEHPTRSDRAPCHCCKRVVAWPAQAGRYKRRVRHKCPHGQWCLAGDRLLGTASNWPRCLTCLNARRAEYVCADGSIGLPPVSRGDSRCLM